MFVLVRVISQHFQRSQPFDVKRQEAAIFHANGPAAFGDISSSISRKVSHHKPENMLDGLFRPQCKKG